MEDRIAMLQDLLKRGAIDDEQFSNLMVSISEAERLGKQENMYNSFGSTARDYVDAYLDGSQKMVDIEDYGVDLEKSLLIPKKTMYKMMARQVVQALDRGDIISIPADLDLSYNLPQGEDGMMEADKQKFLKDTANRLTMIANNSDPNTLSEFFSINRGQSYTNKKNWDVPRFRNMFDAEGRKQDRAKLASQMTDVFNKYVQHSVRVDKKGGQRDVYLTNEGIITPKEVEDDFSSEAYRLGYTEAYKQGENAIAGLGDVIPNLIKQSGKLKYAPKDVMKGYYGRVAEQNPDIIRNMMLNTGDASQTGLFIRSDFEPSSEDPSYVTVKTKTGKEISLPRKQVGGLDQYMSRIEMLESITGSRDRAIHTGGKLWYGGAEAL